MINDVVLEGIVVKTWKYADDLLFRMACYRDPDLPSEAAQRSPGCGRFRHHPGAQGQPGRAGGGREELSRAGARFSAEPGLRREPGGFSQGCPRRRAAGAGKPGPIRVARSTWHDGSDCAAHHEPAQSDLNGNLFD